MTKAYIGIDLGGTKISTALMDEHGAILARAGCETEAATGQDAVIARMVDTAKQVARDGGKADLRGIVAIGVGAPGPLDTKLGVLTAPPNLPGWLNVPLARIIEEQLGVPAYLENDANAAALAEFHYGAGVGCANMIYVTVSTGIGGGIILNGQLYGGTDGAAGEVGHTMILPDGPLCGCGNRGHLEALASGTAIARAARELIAKGVPTLMVELAQGDTSAVTALTVEIAAKRGDLEAQRIIDRAMEYLGIGMANLANIFNPDMIVLGGGVTKMGEMLFAPVRRAVDRFAFPIIAKTVQIVPAKLGKDVGVIGAATVAVLHG
ncbi:MAG: ROK family protein [Chloroflexi bacterium]|nr:ROK family protein [Chloroflexota bacterium]